MALLTRQKALEAGLTPSYAAAAAGGDTVDNSDGKTWIHVKNGGGASITVTITAQTVTTEDPKLGTLAKANIARAIAAGAEAIIGPFKKQAFNNGSNQIAISYSAVTSVTIGAFTIDF